MGLFDKTEEPKQHLIVHPDFPFHALRLIGAAEMAALKMEMHEDPEMQRMGRHLATVTGWFFQGDKIIPWAERGEAQTAILPPQESGKPLRATKDR